MLQSTEQNVIVQRTTTITSLILILILIVNLPTERPSIFSSSRLRENISCSLIGPWNSYGHTCQMLFWEIKAVNYSHKHRIFPHQKDFIALELCCCLYVSKQRKIRPAHSDPALPESQWLFWPAPLSVHDPLHHAAPHHYKGSVSAERRRPRTIDEPRPPSAQHRDGSGAHTRAKTEASAVPKNKQAGSWRSGGPEQSGLQFHSWQPERNCERHLEVDTVTFCTEDPKIYPLIKMTSKREHGKASGVHPSS